MRVIDAFEEPVQTVAVSPDGRFLAAANNSKVRVFGWHSGEQIDERFFEARQLAFTADGERVVLANAGGMRYWSTTSKLPMFMSWGNFSGGVAASPNGRTCIATRSGLPQNSRLEQWSLPSWRPEPGIDFWSPFDRLTFSPNGEYIAGINRNVFELRYAESGGLNRREVVPRKERYLSARFRDGLEREEPPEFAYLTFPLHSETVVYGWDGAFYVMETRNGNVLKRVAAAEDQSFLDAAFLGSGRQLATVDNTPVMRVWSADSWEVVRGYDWGAGNLTCVVGTADGLAAVCGTDTGKLVVFDVDE